ncbi:MAG: DUF5518 domain-containing protein [Natronomonas sp.]
MNRNLSVAAAIGAGVTLVAGVVPFVQLIAPLIGGGAAAYFSDASPKEGIKAGGAAGVLALLLYLPLVLLGALGFASAAVTTSATGGAAVGVGLAAIPFVLLLMILIPTTSALGGVLGGVANERNRTESRDTETDETEGSEPPIERLERRYVDGEIEEPEFEHRLDTILETRRRYDEPTDDETPLAEDEYAFPEAPPERE